MVRDEDSVSLLYVQYLYLDRMINRMRKKERKFFLFLLREDENITAHLFEIIE